MNELHTDATLRCYVDSKREVKDQPERYYNENLVFLFDTETTIDTYQNLLFGSCGVWENGKLTKFNLFHAEDLSESKVKTLRDYASKHKVGKQHIDLITQNEFVELFFEYVQKRRAICICFNAPFDISRLALTFDTSKGSRSRNKDDQNKRKNDAFSFELSKNIYKPRIVIKHINSKSAFIGFAKPFNPNRKTKTEYAGTFLDLKTLTFALTNQSHSLKSACKLFKTKHRKIDTKEHGEVNPEYIKYNVNDVIITYELYQKLVENFKVYGLSKPLNMLYSPASIGKEYFKEMGIKPFLEQNPDPKFPKEMLGKVMTTYFGGRSEVHKRKVPVKVTYLDYTSMYPTIFEWLDLWRFLIAERIDVVEDPSFAEFVQNATLENMRDLKIGTKLTGIALVEADWDILPLRARYGKDRIIRTIGLNFVKGKQLYYAYPDIIASKILTGKVPKIIKAYRFVPVGVQKGLKPINLFGSKLDPSKTSFIKSIIEQRMAIKKLLKQDPNNEDLKIKEHVLKIIANSVGYGIFAEINTVPLAKLKRFSVYGLRHFYTIVDKDEQQGKAFNPIIATLQTSGARLILAMTETFIAQNNGYYAYCDTDSMFVSPELVDKITAFFKPLNPYNVDVEMFKVEKQKLKNGKDGKKLHDVWFLGLAAKRYCLFDVVKGKIKILKYSSHGIGYLSSMSEGWEEEFWKNVIRYHTSKDNETARDKYEVSPDKTHKTLRFKSRITREDIEMKYRDNIVAFKLNITSPTIFRRLKGVEKDSKHVKPFNFVDIGTGYKIDNNTDDLIIPMIPHTKDTKLIPYMQFVDYRTGKVYTDNTKPYWKPLWKLFKHYVESKDDKYEGDIGDQSRRHIIIDNIEYMGKESNSLDITEITGVSYEDETIYIDKITDKNILEDKNTLDIITRIKPEEYADMITNKRIYKLYKTALKTHKNTYIPYKPVISDDKITNKTTLKPLHIKRFLIHLILHITPKQAKQARLSKRQVIRLRNKVRNREEITLYKRTIKKLMSLTYPPDSQN